MTTHYSVTRFVQTFAQIYPERGFGSSLQPIGTTPGSWCAGPCSISAWPWKHGKHFPGVRWDIIYVFLFMWCVYKGELFSLDLLCPLELTFDLPLPVQEDFVQFWLSREMAAPPPLAKVERTANTYSVLHLTYHHHDHADITEVKRPIHIIRGAARTQRGSQECTAPRQSSGFIEGKTFPYTL